ncbi:MAG: TolC family protein [Gemmatimonadales bacterium]
MFRRLTLFVASACFLSIDDAVSQQTQTLVLSLAQCEELALENNIKVMDANSGLALSRAKQAQASHARFLPKFSLNQIVGAAPRARGEFTSTGVLTSPDTSTGLSDLRPFTELTLDLIQPIWTFGKLSRLNDAAAYGVRAGEADVAAKKADVRLQVRKLYWGLVLGYQLLDVVEGAMTEVERADSTLQAKLDEGSDEVSQNDLFKLQLFRYEINKRHRDALDKIELGKSALRAAIGLDESTDFELATKSLDPLDVSVDSLSFYVDLAKRNRPERDQLRAAIDARKSLSRAFRSDYFPQLFLGGQVKYNRASDRFDPRNPFVYNPTNFFRPGLVLGLNWNLNFIQTRDKVRIAQFESARLMQNEVVLDRGIELEVKKAYLAAKQAQSNLRESRRALKASDNWLRAEAQTFDLGISEVKDFIDAFRANGTMEAEHLQNIFKFNTSLAELSKAVGRDFYPNGSR